MPLLSHLEELRKRLLISVIAVLIGPGQIQLTVIPCDPSSAAKDLVKPITPCFAEVYGLILGVAPIPSVEEILTILPQSDFLIKGRAALIKFT